MFSFGKKRNGQTDGKRETERQSETETDRDINKRQKDRLGRKEREREGERRRERERERRERDRETERQRDRETERQRERDRDRDRDRERQRLTDTQTHRQRQRRNDRETDQVFLRLLCFVLFLLVCFFVLFFSQSPHCAANCPQHVRSRDPDTSRATHQTKRYSTAWYIVSHAALCAQLGVLTWRTSLLHVSIWTAPRLMR